MLTLKIALRTLLRRKSRMIAIGILVAFGTFLLVFGGTFTRSAREASRNSIIDNFTGDFIIYSADSKEKPSPFAFQTPLPNIKNIEEIKSFLDGLPEVQTIVPYAQNYALIQVQRGGTKVDLPFIFYAIDPSPYRRIFRNASMVQGEFFGVDQGGAVESGVLISQFQNGQYENNYGVSLEVGEPLTLLGLTEGGSVNAVGSRLLGVFEPRYYKNVFNYINFLDITSYSNLYNFTGVSADSLPSGFNEGLDRALQSEDSLFDLASNADFGKIDLSTLKSEALSGYTMIAIKLKDHRQLERVMAEVEDRQDLNIKVSRWDEASGFFARIAAALQAFIYLATALIFLVVIFIFMNTLIISIIERTSEIGTMRALGAERRFVRRLFLTETLILNAFFSLAAMLVTLALLLVLRPGGIPLPETISQYLIGGGNLPLRLSPLPFIQTLLIVIAASAIATLYPIRVATAITPLRAMSDK
jgi:ABC-type lipoprotein release transport system permease subunit